MKLVKHWNKGPEPGWSVFGGFRDLIEQSPEQPGLNLVFDPSLSSPFQYSWICSCVGWGPSSLLSPQYTKTDVSVWSFSLDRTESVQEMQRSLVSKFYECSLGGCSCVYSLTRLECKETLISQGSLCNWKCFIKKICIHLSSVCFLGDCLGTVCWRSHCLLWAPDITKGSG